MTSQRIQRRIDRLLDQAEQAADEKRWSEVETLTHEVLALDADNGDAIALLGAARRLIDGAIDRPPPL